jgi:non-canonical poly(A) RNA polymerase PAPD5/7
MRNELVDRITDVVLGLWPRAQLKVFGSFAAGICLPTSDIDIVILGEWPVLPLKTLAQSLEVRGI